MDDNMDDNVVRDWFLFAIFGAIMMVAYTLSQMNDNLELITDRIQETNMTYEEYCECTSQKIARKCSNE